VGRRHLRGEVIADETGEPRVIFRTPNWEDYVHVAFTEIRACGASSVQIVRRQRAMLDNLLRSLPEHRHASLQGELGLLDRIVDELYRYPEDRALARVPDPQGLGIGHGVRGRTGPGPLALPLHGAFRQVISR
jgi:hypothetical protein